MSADNVLQRLAKRVGPWGMFFLASGLLVLLLVTTSIIALVASYRRTSSQIEKQLARIRAAGEPATPADLEERYRIPPGEEDLTQLWLEATAPLESPAFRYDAEDLPIVGRYGEKEIPPPGEPWPNLEAAEQLLEKYKTSLELLHDAAEQDGAARYPTNFGEGIAILAPHAPLRHGAWLLALEAHVRAHQGDPHGAARSIHAIFRLARSLEREPLITSQLFRMGCDRIAEEHLRRLLPTVDFPDEELIRLQQDLRATDYHEALYQGMLGDRVMHIQSYNDPASLGISGIRAQLSRLTLRETLALYLDQMEEMIKASKQPWPQALRAVEQAQPDTEDIVDAGTPAILVALLAPAHQMAFRGAAEAAATRDAADAAIAVERYRRKYGKLPESLEPLVPEFLPQVPTDPFDGQPLRYVVQQGGYLIYSVGSDRTDDGGQDDESGEPDVVFRIGPPPETTATDEQDAPSKVPE